MGCVPNRNQVDDVNKSSNTSQVAMKSKGTKTFIRIFFLKQDQK